MSNNRGRGNTAGAAGCPQVFIPASLELGWKLSNELMSKNWGRGNTTGAVGCPGVFIPASSTAWLDLAWFAFEGKLALLYNLVGPGTTMSWWTKYLIIRVGYSPAEELVVI